MANLLGAEPTDTFDSGWFVWLPAALIQVEQVEAIPGTLAPSLGDTLLVGPSRVVGATLVAGEGPGPSWPDVGSRRALERRWPKGLDLIGGELQRLAVARALATGPSLVLADEPTDNLDFRTAWSVMQALIESRPEGTSVLVATHDRRVAELCDREVKLVDGIATEMAS